MLISELGIRNFKSYGNNEQVLKLNTTKGELILLVGKNGSGKSSLINSIDYALYGKVKGNKKKWVTLSTLPNRINKELSVRVKFISENTPIEVIRTQNPSSLTLIENGIVNERAGKKNIDDKIQKYVGLDIETFKSFISMSINDFKNFINLSNEEKKLLLDKLFNLETINILNDILKSISKDNKEQLLTLDKEISTIDDSINSIKRSIEKSKKKKQESLSSSIEFIKESILSKKSDYLEIKERVGVIQKKDDELNDIIDSTRSEYLTIKSEISMSVKQLSLYNSGRCPTCSSDLTTSTHLNMKDVLEAKKDKQIEIREELEKKLTYLKDKKTELSEISNKANSSYLEIKNNLRSMKMEIEKIQSLKDDESSYDISEFLKTVDELEMKKNISNNISNSCLDKQIYHKELSKVFSESGIKKMIINNILNPINHFISTNVKKMGMDFEITLDNTFSATIKHLGQEVEHESLSTGENKRINVCILISYIMMIRTKRSINVLFLDEVFSSIDISGIKNILDLLKSFANEYNINIFVVHHSFLDNDYFDRVIHLRKDIFSSIDEMGKLEAV